MTPSDPTAPVPGAVRAPVPEPPARRRRQWTDAEKAEYLALFAESGLPSATFCREMELPEATLWLWRRQAREAVSAAAGFATVQVVDPPPGPPAPPRAAGLTLTLRWPTGLQAQLTGLDAPLVETLLEPVLRALPARATSAR